MNIHRFAALGLLFLLTHSVLAADTRELRFPDLKDGRLVLSVDTHTHSVFSDGHVTSFSIFKALDVINCLIFLPSR